MKRPVKVTVDGEEVQFYLQKKSESRLHNVIARLPFIPDAYMENFWSTIYDVVSVSGMRSRERDFGEPSWMGRHYVTLRHEARHVRNAKRFTLPVFATYYVGPSIAICLPMMLFWLVWGLCTGSWTWLGWTAIAFVVMLPLSFGFAIGRALEEWYAYEERVRIHGTEWQARWIAKALWYDYGFTIPPALTMRWFARRLDKPEWLGKSRNSGPK